MSYTYLTNMFSEEPTCTPLTSTVDMVSRPSATSTTDGLANNSELAVRKDKDRVRLLFIIP